MHNPFLTIQQRFPLKSLPSGDQPVFIFSTIWRSGSTVLQRTLVTDDSIQVWGEPYADCNLIQSLSRSAMALTQQNWPQARHFLDHQEIRQNPENFFIANWYPPMQAMQEAHRAMLDRLFKQTAIEMGKQRFGIKFVRLSLEDLFYLQWLYPDAKFLILVRNPWDCWRSYKGNQWMYRWPKGLVSKVTPFAKIWQKQTQELLSHQEDPNIKVLRYEDFLHPEFNWDTLRQFCGLPHINQDALAQRIPGTQTAPHPVIEKDCQDIERICGLLARQLGYRGLKDTDMTMRIGDWRQ